MRCCRPPYGLAGYVSAFQGQIYISAIWNRNCETTVLGVSVPNTEETDCGDKIELWLWCSSKQY